MTNAKRHVIFASDDRGFGPLQVAVYSLLKSADAAHSLQVSVLTGCSPLSAEHRNALEGLMGGYPFAHVEVIDCDELLSRRMSSFNDDAVWGRMAWARCLIGELFPEEHGNIVYLDIDTFVCCDLAELYNLNLGSNVLAAVPEERRETGVAHDPIWTNGLLNEKAERYCNSGVLVMNVDAFRDEQLLDRIIEWYRVHHQQLIRPDQDTLNSLFWDRIVYLHPRYNHCDGWLERQLKENPDDTFWRGNTPQAVLEAVAEPAILHFWGPKKPWRWNHRPEGVRYVQAMRELSMIADVLPETTFLRRCVSMFFAVYHGFLWRIVSRRLRKLATRNMV